MYNSQFARTTLALLGVLIGSGVAWAQPAPNAETVNAALGLAASAVIALDVAGPVEHDAFVSVTIDGAPATLYLLPFDIRSDDFEVLVPDGRGSFQALPNPPSPRTVRGTVVEWPGSEVVGSLGPNTLTARVRTRAGAVWFIEPLGRRFPAAPAGTHVVYAQADVIPPTGICGVTAEMEETARQRAEAESVDDQEPWRPESARGRGTTQATEVSVDTDYQFYQIFNDVADAVDDVETTLVGVDVIYRSEVAISYVLNRIVIRSTPTGTYTSTDPATLLDQFRDEWESTYDAQERDVAHLMVGRNLDASVAGIAYIREICNRNGLFTSGGYGLTQRLNVLANRVENAAHELGHNWSANHCSDEADASTGCSGPGFNFDSDCQIMCACLSGCTGVITQFGSAATASIINHRDSRSCLDTSRSITYVDASYSGDEDGSTSSPYDTFREGYWATDSGGTVRFAGGTYDADRVVEILNRPMTLEKWSGAGGSVVIGQ